jgi:hypothetical protein
MIAPTAGFTQRWQSGLAARREQEQRNQSWKTFLLLSGGSFITLLVLVVCLLLISSPADWMAVFVRSVNGSLDLFATLVSAVRAWLATTPLALNIALWIYLSITLCLLTLGWVFALWRTSIIGVFNK